MPALKDIQRRIRSVGKTQKITRAMRMVAAAKLRRAQDALIAARPYAMRLYGALAEIQRRHQDGLHPLMRAPEDGGALGLLVVASDRGLCGAFNHAVLRLAEGVVREQAPTFRGVEICVVGRKPLEHFRRRGEVTRAWTGRSRADYAEAAEIAGYLGARYASGALGRVLVVGTEFVSAGTQRPRVVTLLPLGVEAPALGTSGEPIPFEMEPDPRALLDVLVPQALEFTVYRILLENDASEQAARMTAMESATRNTEELIRALTLQYNRARQAAITKELVEIVSGAEAL